MKIKHHFLNMTPATVIAAAMFAGVAGAQAQTLLTIDGTSGSNSISTAYTLTGNTTMNLGFFADYLVVGGGAGGSGSPGGSGGGGGGGGRVALGQLQLSSDPFGVNVGGGGAAGGNDRGGNGGASQFASVTANGGSPTGGTLSPSGGNAGGNSGRIVGGVTTTTTGGSPSSLIGLRAGGGGAGSGANGGNASPGVGGTGGNGLSSSITGTATFYGGGGGGGAEYTEGDPGAGRQGGLGGGGRGALNNANASFFPSFASTAGTPNTGGGGGGAGGLVNEAVGTNSAAGGSGIVIVRYAGSSLGNIGGTVSAGTGSAANTTLHTFTNPGAATFDMSSVDLDTRLGATLTSPVSGSGSLIYAGPGTLTLAANSTYTGTTTVQGGQLTVNGSIASTATVRSGARIGGSGRVGGLILESGSILTPGNSPGTLSVNGNATWNSGANYNWQVYAANTNPAVQTGAGTGWDFLDVSGSLTFSGLDSSNRFNLNLWSLSSTSPDTNGPISGWDPNVGSTWLIASAAGGINLNGTSLAANTNYSSLFNINTGATNGTGGWSGALPSSFQVLTLGDANALYLQAVAGSAAVPEPGQVAASLLLLAGIGGYVWLKRRKTAKAAAPTVV